MIMDDPRSLLRLACLSCWLTLALGCAHSAPPDTPPAEPEPTPPATLDAVAYFAWLEDAPREALREELTRLHTMGAPQTLVEEAQLALLLSASALSDREHELRARKLLDALIVRDASGARESNYLEFARIWRRVLVLRENLAFAADFMRSAGENMRATDENLRQVREDLKTAEATRESSAQQIRELETQIESLKRQIEALTTIEQQLIEREQSQSR